MKGIVLCSGGLDSTLALIKLLEQGHEVVPMFVDYNQWSLKGEKQAISDVGFWLAQEPMNIDVSDTIPVIIETRWDVWFDRQPRVEGSGTEVTKVYETEVGSAWGRGIALVGLAAMWAYTHGDDYDFIALGSLKGDAGPDCKPGLFDKGMDTVLRVATRGKMELLLPIGELTIEDIGRELAKSGIPWNLMYSCYWEPPCGYRSSNDSYRCPGCRRKVLAMRAGGVTDEKLLELPNASGRSYQSRLAEEAGY